MPRVETIKVIENPLAAVTGEDDLDGDGGGLNEARIPLLSRPAKRHSSPTGNEDPRHSRGPISSVSSTGSQVQGKSPSSSQILGDLSTPKSGLSPSGSSTTSNANSTTSTTAVNGKRISQSQSLHLLDRNQPVTKPPALGKYGAGSTSVQRGATPGTVIVVSGKEGGKPTSGFLATDPLLSSSSPSADVPGQPRSNSQTCFPDDGYCIAVTKNAEGGGGGSSSGGKRGAGGGSEMELNLSTSTLRPIEDGVEENDRETWSQGLDFLLSIIGFAVDLANVWRFPYFCYKNGGGAFLVPYFLMLALSAIPVFYMELLLGQSIRQGPISMWKICPLFKGVGYCAVTVSYFVSFYYNTIMGWSLHFTISSLSSPLPWTSCNNSWNTKNCYSPESLSKEELFSQDENGALSAFPFGMEDNETAIGAVLGEQGSERTFLSWGNRSQDAPFLEGGLRKRNETRPPNATSPASEYFRNCVLEMGGHDIDNLGSPKVDLLVCLAFIYCLLYIILFRGIRSTGKVVYVTALLPYLVMLILLIRGVMLEGAVDGIYYYLVPNMTKLWEIGVWSDAAKQIFFSSGAGFGVHLTYASYNNFHNNCYRDCIVTSCVNCFTSIFSGFVIFTFLGSMAHRQGRPISEVVNVGPGLVFEVYPEAVGTLPGANFWSLLFFIMLIMLGIDSAMGGLECVITGITDEFKGFFKTKKHGRECFMFFCVLLSFLIGMVNVTRGGMYTFQFLDTYAAGSSLLLSVLFEILAVSWVYGLDQLCKDAEAMLGFAPGLYWRVCWKFVSPALIAIIIVLDLSTTAELTHEGYRYPDWAQTFGYIFTFIPITLVPIVGFIEFMKYPGDCKTKLSYSITPVSEHAAIKNGETIKRFRSKHWSYFR